MRYLADVTATSGLDQDVEHLRTVQYRDSTELAKRANVHVAYRTAESSAFEFLASSIEWPAGGRVLDVGCGSGYLWGEIAALLPDGIELVLTDLSNGMVDEAVERAHETGRFASVTGHPCDARDLPFDDGAFDVVVSTYALYHVPRPGDAVEQVARVVRDDGVVGIMTNGPGHLAEIEAIRVEVFGDAARYGVNHTFSPAIAAATLVDAFDDVRWRRYDDTLRITDVGDVTAFITSSPPADDASPAQLARLDSLVRSQMVGGVFTVAKDTGAFVCAAPIRRRRRNTPSTAST